MVEDNFNEVVKGHYFSREKNSGEQVKTRSL